MLRSATLLLASLLACSLAAPAPGQVHRGPVRRVAFSPDGSRVVSAGADRSVRIWNAATGELVRGWYAHEDEVLSARVSANGKRLATAGRDGKLRVWDLERARATPDMDRGAVLREFDSDGTGRCPILFDPEGRWAAAVTSKGELRFHSVDDRGFERFDAASLAGKPYDLAYSPESGLVLATVLEKGENAGETDFRIASWRLRIPNAERIPRSDVYKGFADLPHSTVLAPDGSWMATAFSNGQVRRWSITRPGSTQHMKIQEAWNVQAFAGEGEEEKDALSLAAPADGSWVAAGGACGRIVLLHARTQAVVCTIEGPGAPVEALDATADGSRLAAGLADGRVLVFDAATGAILAEAKEPADAALEYADPRGLFATNLPSGWTWSFRSSREFDEYAFAASGPELADPTPGSRLVLSVRRSGPSMTFGEVRRWIEERTRATRTGTARQGGRAVQVEFRTIVPIAAERSDLFGEAGYSVTSIRIAPAVYGTTRKTKDASGKEIDEAVPDPTEAGLAAIAPLVEAKELRQIREDVEAYRSAYSSVAEREEWPLPREGEGLSFRFLLVRSIAAEKDSRLARVDLVHDLAATPEDARKVRDAGFEKIIEATKFRWED
ncbi:MAG: hypothetical protein HY720_07305 [Planctomycetes bacterium]|nr:hypothetical protein [Planctomycetota bacterium]